MVKLLIATTTHTLKIGTGVSFVSPVPRSFIPYFQTKPRPQPRHHFDELALTKANNTCAEWYGRHTRSGNYGCTCVTVSSSALRSTAAEADDMRSGIWALIDFSAPDVDRDPYGALV